MGIEQEIWDEFKEYSEHDILSDRATRRQARQYFGIEYGGPLESISRVNSHQYVRGDIDYRIEKALQGEQVNWDEIIKLYPVRPKVEIKEKKAKAPRIIKPKYPEPKWRTVEQRKQIDNLLLLKYNSIEELNELFRSENEAKKYLQEKRWKKDVVCPYCGSNKVYLLTGLNQYSCGNYKECRKRFSLISGTIFENTKMPLTTWFKGIYLLTSENTQKISTHQLAKAIGITQKTSWGMMQKIKSSISDPIFTELTTGLFNTDNP